MNDFARGTSMRFHFLATAALVACVVLPLCTAGAQSQAGLAAPMSVTLRPNGPEAFSNVAPLTPEQHQMMYEKLLALRHQMLAAKGPVASGPRAVDSALVNAKETVLAADAEVLPTPGALYIGNNKPYNIVGDGQSTVAEPAIMNSGGKWFVTQNWSRGYSTNEGATFTAIADDAGPADAPFFCCDQDAVHDHGRDVSIWSELFLNGAQNTGVIRLHVRKANNLVDTCTYDLNGGAGVEYDYPHLGLGNNYIYITANGITNGGWSGAIVWRYNLDQMARCQSISGNVFTWTGSVGQVVWVPARATTDTMYLVTIENSSQNRIFWWPENTNSIFWNVYNVPSSNFGAATCTGGLSGNNWMGDGLSTSSIGFQIRSAVAQDNGVQYLATYYTVAPTGGITQAFAQGTIWRTQDMVMNNFAPIFNNSVCFGYPDVTANSRGDLGLMIGIGGSTTGGSAASSVIGISDDYSRSGTRGFFATVATCAPANDQGSRWGDYLTARVQEPVDTAFIGAGFGVISGTGGVTHVCEYMRGRYAQAWLDRKIK